MPSTTPPDDTMATRASALCQATVRPVRAAPLESRSVTISASVSPATIVAESGASWTLATVGGGGSPRGGGTKGPPHGTSGRRARGRWPFLWGARPNLIAIRRLAGPALLPGGHPPPAAPA